VTHNRLAVSSRVHSALPVSRCRAGHSRLLFGAQGALYSHASAAAYKRRLVQSGHAMSR
jgi:hypothetical protein